MEKFAHLLINSTNPCVFGCIKFHNGGGYDFHLLLAALLKANLIGKKTKIKKLKECGAMSLLKQGSKITTFEMKTYPKSLKALDTYRMIPMSLDNAAKTMDAPSYLRKGKSSFDIGYKN